MMKIVKKMVMMDNRAFLPKLGFEFYFKFLGPQILNKEICEENGKTENEAFLLKLWGLSSV